MRSDARNRGKLATLASNQIDYTVWILHLRPEIDNNTEFILTYKAKDEKDKKSVEEKFAQAFKTAHPKWVIKKVTVEETP